MLMSLWFRFIVFFARSSKHTCPKYDILLQSLGIHPKGPFHNFEALKSGVPRS